MMIYSPSGKGVYHAYYHVSGSNVISENVSFYEQGRTYNSASPNIGFDLTDKLEPKHELPWAYRASKFTYEKDRLPERIEFSWPDASSRFFEGVAVESNSPWVDDGNIQQVSIPRFTVDIELALALPEIFSNEGFFWLQCDRIIEDGITFYKVKQSTADEDLDFYPRAKIMNGHLNFGRIAIDYYRHAFPGDEGEMIHNLIFFDDQFPDQDQIYSIRKAKVQTIQIYQDDQALTLEGQLVTTNLGTGELLEVVENINSGTLQLTVLLDTL